ncbi:hypothetical protein [Phytomonospora endophytica]|uniref:Uncharacterized protein n=1 Tax=Phytomonospora endophytica TaxID=714109 RepID=A0A841G1C3_9ACTN|nr:hypothetical protein [Phytomonospora endophytica]MBB6039552.1 hypothetical protein [Phytomonospora endophytica]GIG70516.1 hypothetical protein Pen01_68110 [Phytomonospora endophytica]
MLDEKLDALSQMMAQHMARPFPPGLRGLEIDDQDLVMLDADAYGCVASVREGPLSERHRAGLTQLTSVFESVLPAIDDTYATEYYAHLHNMIVLAADIERLRGK